MKVIIFVVLIKRCIAYIKTYYFHTDADINGDISGDDQSVTSDHNDQNDDNSMDSDRGGALNLVSHKRNVLFSFLVQQILTNKQRNEHN